MDWHDRFLQQAGWTRPLRDYLFARAGLTDARCVLEVGCGTGALLADLPTRAAVHGLDLDAARLTDAHIHAPEAALTRGDALQLPYPSEAFDITFCHFLLLWVPDPLGALLEMKRVTSPGGYVLALAEPDYDHRVDKPATLATLGHWQAEALRRQGADPGLGARLGDLFRQSGMQLIEAGPMQQGGTRPLSPIEQEMEWDVLEADLARWVPEEEIQRLKQLDRSAWERGERVLHVPTYFAWGKCPMV